MQYTEKLLNSSSLSGQELDLTFEYACKECVDAKDRKQYLKVCSKYADYILPAKSKGKK